jgi:hypothetical protein
MMANLLLLDGDGALPGPGRTAKMEKIWTNGENSVALGRRKKRLVKPGGFITRPKAIGQSGGN